MRLLLVGIESDRLADVLREAGHETRHAEGVAEADLVQRSAPMDAVICAGDVSVVRKRLPGLPVAVWLAGASTAAVADAFEAGAAEVVHPGMGEREIAARINGLAARNATPRETATWGPLTVDRERGEAAWHGRRLPLTSRERDVLYELAAAAGATLRRDAIYRAVWGYAMTRGDRSVDVNVKRLRDKLAAAVGAPISIETEPGVGYRLVVADAAVTAL